MTMWEFVDITTGKVVQVDSTNTESTANVRVVPTVENTVRYCFEQYDDLLRRLGDT